MWHLVFLVIVILNEITYVFKRTFKRLYKIWWHKLHSLKSIANFLLALVVTSYVEKFRALQMFRTQCIFTHYYESCDRNCDKIQTSVFKGTQIS